MRGRVDIASVSGYCSRCLAYHHVGSIGVLRDIVVVGENRIKQSLLCQSSTTYGVDLFATK